MTGKDIFDLGITEMPTLLDGIIGSNSISILAGNSDTGKSTFLRELAFHVANGSDEFIGIPLNIKNRKAIYVSTEDDESSLGAIFQKRFKSDNSDALDNIKFFFDPSSVLTDLKDFLAHTAVDLIVVDCLADVMQCNLNQSNEVRVILEKYRQIAMSHNCAVIFLHHVGKASSANISKHSLLGSQGIEGKARLVLILSKGNKPRDLNLHIVKGNYISPEDKEKVLCLSIADNLEIIVSERTHVVTNDISYDVYIEEAAKLVNTGRTYAQAHEVVKDNGYPYGKSTLNKSVRTFLKKLPSVKPAACAVVADSFIEDDISFSNH